MPSWIIAYVLLVAVIVLVPILVLIGRHILSKPKQRYVPPLRPSDRSH